MNLRVRRVTWPSDMIAIDGCRRRWVSCYRVSARLASSS